MEKEVRDLINRLRPYLNRDGGDLEFVKVEDGIVYVRMLGACIGCALIDSTLYDGIERILVEQVPGVIAVVTVD